MIWLASFVVGVALYPNIAGLVVSTLLFTAASMRLYSIQHDCGHRTYFSNRRWNDWVGVLLGAFTANPFYCMRYNHNKHHTHIGNLDHMDEHEVLTWTAEKWRGASAGERLFYRLYRSPISVLLLGPIAIILVRYRFPKNATKVGLWDPILQNVMMFALWTAVIVWGGWPAGVVLVLGIFATISFGTLIVYSGHNHQDTYWATTERLNYNDAVLQGSSVLTLGPVFDFMSLNFAYHDLHHLNPMIPAYRLKQCYRALEHQIPSTKINLFDMFATLKWKVWDEDRGCMVTFRAADQNSKRTLHHEVPAE